MKTSKEKPQKETYKIIETKPNGERVEHGIYYDIMECDRELRRLCFSGLYPGSNWSFITQWREF